MTYFFFIIINFLTYWNSIYCPIIDIMYTKYIVVFLNTTENSCQVFFFCCNIQHYIVFFMGDFEWRMNDEWMNGWKCERSVV